MKKILLAGFLILSTSSYALSTGPVTDVYKCKLDSKRGPFSSFELSVDREMDEDFGGELTAANYILATWTDFDSYFESGEFDRIDNDQEYMMLEVSGDKYEDEVYFEFEDWAGANINFSRDDDGHFAFVDYSSDGPRIAGFYRCEKTTTEK